MRACRRIVVWSLVVLFAGAAHAAPVASDYQTAMQLAAQGQDVQAAARLRERMKHVEWDDAWHDRLEAAASLLESRSQFSADIDLSNAPMQLALAGGYISGKPAPDKASTWPVGALSLIAPGGGHAWLGRWRDAGVAAMMVWPMIGLTLWAARRRMGPVTVFFALITIWLWSGVIFSALSMAEREAAEAYMQWWQGLWGATGLPGRPW